MSFIVFMYVRSRRDSTPWPGTSLQRRIQDLGRILLFVSDDACNTKRIMLNAACSQVVEHNMVGYGEGARGVLADAVCRLVVVIEDDVLQVRRKLRWRQPGQVLLVVLLLIERQIVLAHDGRIREDSRDILGELIGGLRLDFLVEACVAVAHVIGLLLYLKGKLGARTHLLLCARVCIPVYASVVGP